MRGHYVFQQVLELAETLVRTEPVVSRQFADFAGRLVQGLDGADRVSAQAKLGTMLIRLGDRADGIALIESAAAGSTELQGQRADKVAIALASYDLQRGLGFMPPEQEGYERNRLRANIAIAAAGHDPEGAAELLDHFAPPNARLRKALAAVAYSVGRNSPDEARNIVEAYGAGTREYDRIARTKAQALG